MIPADWSRAGWTPIMRWGPLCLWVATISTLSTGAFSAAQTGRFIEPFLRWLFPGAPGSTILALHSAVRKGMHVTEFAALALLWYRGLSRERRGWQPRAALMALGLAVLTGVADEAHQAFVPSRTASAMDVAWDSPGALCGLAGWSTAAGGTQIGAGAGDPKDGPPGRVGVAAGD